MKPNPNLVTTRLGDELVIYHLGNDRFYTLNGTGARIWELFNDGRDERQIERQLLQEFTVDEARLARELTEIVASFVHEQLLVVDGPR